ncbi:MAG: MMPL family transporter [Rhizobiales bacterium]|nr:MMPL family transporter [Hyphomicrobiales bacterium]MBO6697935.1 MMPL family transporter [Hyphomicrobiales bacterium]MBO6735811.1 MMPL family transporter [Hyphomicrobiales bacterium]MBO6913822.1 MMPL family transporter [Hyphomicrobiales bacterium]MBO6955525.1 MMPL family transporter [Hyphomicrobiales bacterium]
MAAALIGLTVVLAAVSLPSLTFEADLQRGFSAGTADEQAYGALLRERSTRSRPVMLLVEADAPFSVQDLEQLNALMLDLSLTPGIAQVISPFSLRYPPSDASTPGGLVLRAADGQSGLRALLDYTSGITGLSPMVAGDLATMIATIVPSAGLSLGDMREVLADVEALIAPLEGDRLQISITGEDAIAFALTDALSQDLVVLNAVGSLAAFLIALVALRSVRWAIVAFLPAVMAAFTALALFSLLGLPITVLSVVVPILVLVLALADGMHLATATRANLKTQNLDDALRSAIAQVAPANALTSITTAIGFAAIGVSSFAKLDELALSGSVSVLAAYWVVTAGVVTLLPIVQLRLLGSLKQQLPNEKSRRPPHPTLPRALPHLVLRRPVVVLVLGAIVFGISAVASSRVEAWFPLYANLPDDSDVGRAHRLIEERFGGYLPLWFEFQADSPDEAWPTTGAISAAIAEAAPRLTVLSEVTLADWLGDATERPDNEFVAQLPSALVVDLYSAERGIHRIVVLAPEPMHDRASRIEHDAMVEAARAAGAEHVFGFPAGLRTQGLSIVHQLGQSLFVACIVATLMVALAYRSPLLAPLLMLPNLLPLLVATALLHVFHQGFANPTAVLALTVAFGIAIDDSIHILNRYLVERSTGLDTEKALTNTIQRTGGVLLVTTLVICVGTASTFFSSFPNVRLFGVMLITIFTSALVADLLLLPALIKKGWWR